MNEDFARAAWADHHARLAADLSRGFAHLTGLFRRHAAPPSLPGIGARSMSQPPHDQAGAVIDAVDDGLPEPTGSRAP